MGQMRITLGKEILKEMNQKNSNLCNQKKQNINRFINSNKSIEKFEPAHPANRKNKLQQIEQPKRTK